MRWLRRSVLLCLLIVVVTPAPAHAWFEWLHRLSGPGPWNGLKADIRAFCSGIRLDEQAPRQSLAKLQNALLTGTDAEATTAALELQGRFEQLRKLNATLRLFPDTQLTALESQFQMLIVPGKNLLAEVHGLRTTERVASVGAFFRSAETLEDRARNALIGIAGGGIFVNLCPQDKLRKFAFEIGLTGLGTPGDDTYARGKSIWLTTVTGGLSYRVPFPVSHDFLDLGVNLGAYRFYSEGFDDFSGFAFEPYFDVHLPTSFQLDGSKWERFFGRFTVRAGLQFFPAGIEASAFNAIPGTPDVSGKEGNLSLTVFFRMNQ